MTMVTEPRPPAEPPPQSNETKKKNQRKKQQERSKQRRKEQSKETTAATNSSRRNSTRNTKSVFSDINKPRQSVHHGDPNTGDKPMTVFRALAKDVSPYRAGELTEEYMQQLEEQDDPFWYKKIPEVIVGMWRRISRKEESEYQGPSTLTEFITNQHLLELFELQDRRFRIPREQLVRNNLQGGGRRSMRHVQSNESSQEEETAGKKTIS